MIVWLEALLQDIRIAVRLLRRTPSLTGIALLSTALSVGATAVVFTAIKAVLLNPLPYTRPTELVQLRTDFAGPAAPMAIGSSGTILRKTKEQCGHWPTACSAKAFCLWSEASPSGLSPPWR
jgi:hypothetical protein